MFDEKINLQKNTPAITPKGMGYYRALLDGFGQ